MNKKPSNTISEYSIGLYRKIILKEKLNVTRIF